MLIEFSVENYLSFHERVTFSMMAAPELDASDGLLDNTFEAPGGIRLLKSALLYGANASGKSNLVKAIDFARRFVQGSATAMQFGDAIAVTPFKLRPALAERGSVFEFVWLDGVEQFRYQFRVTPSRVLQERLAISAPGNAQERVLFVRAEQSFEAEQSLLPLTPRTRENALFLSVAAQFNVDVATRVLGWFWKCRAVSGLADSNLLSFTQQQLLKEEWAREILRLAREADFGIVGIDPELFLFRHQALDEHGEPAGEVELHFLEESEGTKKFVALAGPLLEVVKNSMTLFIDEFDARLHPRLARAVVQLFQGDANPGNAQLIAATHDTNLLDRRLVRRDQIWFTEKDAGGATKLYSLAEFDLPDNAVYERDYLLGKYGAVPVIGALVRPPEKA